MRSLGREGSWEAVQRGLRRAVVEGQGKGKEKEGGEARGDAL